MFLKEDFCRRRSQPDVFPLKPNCQQRGSSAFLYLLDSTSVVEIHSCVIQQEVRRKPDCTRQYDTCDLLFRRGFECLLGSAASKHTNTYPADVYIFEYCVSSWKMYFKITWIYCSTSQSNAVTLIFMQDSSSIRDVDV